MRERATAGPAFSRQVAIIMLNSISFINKIIINIARYFAKQKRSKKKKRPKSSYIGCKKDNSYLLNKH